MVMSLLYMSVAGPVSLRTPCFDACWRLHPPTQTLFDPLLVAQHRGNVCECRFVLSAASI